MAVRKKRSLSIPPDVDAGVEAAAREAGLTYSAWVTQALRKELIIRDGLAAALEVEAEIGPFTEAELAEADAWVTETLARSKRTGEPIRRTA